MALNAIDVGSLENFLLPAPTSVAILGQLMAIASTIDFSLEKHEPIDGFKHVKQPGSFRACLVQISTSGCDAFTTGHKNMDKIRLYCLQFQGHVKDLVRIILNGSTHEKSTLAPMYLNDMMEKSKKCLELAKKTESDFEILTALLSEVSMAAITAKKLHESNLANALVQTQVLKKRKEFAERQKCEIEEEKLEVIEQLSKAKSAFDEIQDKIPSPEQAVGIAIYEKVVNTLTTSACLFGLATISAPVAVSVIVTKGVVDLGKKVFENSSKEENKKDNTAAMKIALKNAPEIQGLLRSLNRNIERRLCQDTINHDTGNTQENQPQVDEKIKKHDEIQWISDKFESIVKELNESAFSDHNEVEATRHLCNCSMSVCVSLKQNRGDIKAVEDLLNEVKIIAKQAENLKIRSDLLFNLGSTACFNITVDPSNDNDEIVKQATENVLLKMESRKQTLEFVMQKQEAVKQKAHEMNQQQTRLLEELLKTNLQKIDFEEIIQTISKGMEALGQLHEQWNRMVIFFSQITSRIEICIYQDTQTFQKVLEGAGYKLTAGTHEIILETAAGINSIAYSVGLIANTYTDVSGKYLVGATAGLIGMIALHPEKDAIILDQKRRDLNKKCANAQVEIRKLADERREMALDHINKQFERIQSLELELPEVEDDRKIEIHECVAENSRYIRTQSGKDANDFV